MEKDIDNFINSAIKKLKNKQFTNEVSGYDMTDVDEFLDQIISNMENIKNYIIIKNNEVDEYKLKIKNISHELERALKTCEIYGKLHNKHLRDSGNYMSILDRVTKLEEKIYD